MKVKIMPSRPNIEYYDVRDYGSANRAVDTIEANQEWAILHYQQFGHEDDHYEIWVEGHSYSRGYSLREAQIIIQGAIERFMRGNPDW